MQVKVRDIVARCRKCGGMDFSLIGTEPVRLTSPMACIACADKTTYRELLEAIGEEAMRRANEALEKLRKTTPRPRKPTS